MSCGWLRRAEGKMGGITGWGDGKNGFLGDLSLRAVSLSLLGAA